jgi:hypothetical protein
MSILSDEMFVVHYIGYIFRIHIHDGCGLYHDHLTMIITVAVLVQ